MEGVNWEAVYEWLTGRGYCPNGPGGGVTNTCGGSGGGAGGSAAAIAEAFTPAERALPAKSKQPHKTQVELYAACAEAKGSFDNGLNHGQGVDKAIGAKVERPSTPAEFQKAMQGDGPVVVIAGLKGEKRAREKVEGKYGGDWSQLTDVTRATVAVDKPSDVPKAIDAIRTHMGKSGWEMATAPDDRMSKPLDTGYRDINMLLRHKGTGVLAELQVNTKSMIRAKEGRGHKLYEEYRSIMEGVKKAGRTPTADETKRIKAIEQESRTLYADAWNKA